jgi:hypothetical protein
MFIDKESGMSESTRDGVVLLGGVARFGQKAMLADFIFRLIKNGNRHLHALACIYKYYN